MGRSYCGTALFVKVTHAHSDVLVFAHFEEADANVLRVGDTIPTDRIASSVQTEQTPKGEWIEGALHSTAVTQRDSTRVFEINSGARWYYEWGSAATKAQRFTKHVLRVYVLERVPSHKPDLHASAPSVLYDSDTMLRVVAVATSSSFMVVSYRRAADETRADRRLLALLASSAGISPAALQAASVDGDSDSGVLSREASSLLLQRARFAGLIEKEELAPPHHHPQLPFPPSTGSPDNSPSTRTVDHAELMWQEKKLWESAHPETLMLTKHLAILHCFLSCADATHFTQCLAHWSAMFAHEWSSSHDARANDQASDHSHQQHHHHHQQQQQQRYHPYDAQARSDLQRGAVVSSTRISWYFMVKLAASADQAAQARVAAMGETHAVSRVNERVSSAVQLCADVAGWLVFHSNNVSVFQRLFADLAPALLDKHVLRDAFVKWVRLVYDLIDQYLATAAAASPSVGGGHPQQYASTQSLVEDIIAMVFQCHELETIRPAVLTILSATSMHGLAGFVAQVRSQFVRGSSFSSEDGTTRNNMALTRVLHTFTSPLHGTWVFDGTQTVIEPLDISQVHRISLVNTLDWLRECSIVEICVEDDERLALRSRWSLSSPSDRVSEGMALVADGHARVFSHFPSGLSSMIAIGDRYYGDYQASFRMPDSLVIELFAWSESSSPRTSNRHESNVPQWGGDSEGKAQPAVIRSQLHLSLERFGRPTATPGAPILHVEVAVELGFCSASRDMTEGSNLHERLDAIRGWTPAYQISATYRRAQ